MLGNVARRGKQPACLDGRYHIACLDGYDAIAEIKPFHERNGGEGAFDKCLRDRRTELFEDVFFERTGIYPDAQGDVRRFSRIDHHFQPIFRPDIAGVDPHLVGARFDGTDGKRVPEMDIGDQRHVRRTPDGPEREECGFVGNGQADDPAPCGVQPPDLSERRLDIGGIGIRHGLNDDGCTAADGYIANHDPSGYFSGNHRFLNIRSLFEQAQRARSPELCSGVSERITNISSPIEDGRLLRGPRSSASGSFNGIKKRGDLPVAPVLRIAFTPFGSKRYFARTFHSTRRLAWLQASSSAAQPVLASCSLP
jgi:hypothetical protein